MNQRICILVCIFAVLASVSAVHQSKPIRKPSCIAHRGFSSHFPENSMLAFTQAIKYGADGIELDVDITKDNVVVVIHDDKVDRTTNGKGVVRELLWSQIEPLKAKRDGTKNFGECEMDTTIKRVDVVENGIPKLTDVLEMLVKVNRKIGVVIDIKYDRPVTIVTEIGNILSQPRYKSLLPHITLGIWSTDFIPTLQKVTTELPQLKKMHIGKTVSVARSQFFNAVDDFSLDQVEYTTDLGKMFIKDAHAEGKVVTAWTVNKAEEMKGLENVKVDNIITDCPVLCEIGLSGGKNVENKFNIQESTD